MFRVLKNCLSLITLAAVVVVTAQAFAQTRNRITQAIVESDVVTLGGNTHPMARAEFDRGEIAEDTRLGRMVLVLKPSAGQQRDLDALTEAQQEPRSPEYHHWLSPQEYGARFGVSAVDLTKISGWLTGHGFVVEPIPAGRRTIVFSGTSGQVAAAFHTRMHRFAVNGVQHIANIEDPQVPEAFAPVVAGVLSLHDFRRISATRKMRAVASPEYTQGSTHYMFPADFATIYNLNPLYAAGQNGSGASIAIVGRSNINLGDVTSFRSSAGLAAKAPTIILDGANPGLIAGDQDEATLDVEWSGAVAAGATVKFVVAGSTGTSDGVDLAAQYIVNNKTAAVMSTSFGNCEANMGSAEMAFYNSLWQQAASEGITSFVSSGDSGAAGCSGGSASSGSRAGVNGLCSSPYATCVGGTEFNEGSGNYWASTNGTGGGSALGYIPEKVWNESGSGGGSGLWSSGGGMSSYYAQPSWQAGVSGANSNGMRAVPDVSLTAASHDGYLVCLNGNWYVYAGTSASSPAFAGILAVLEQKLGLAGQGNANPILYGLLSASGNPFHATPTGNNTVPGVAGFTASGAAYNLATGLGSVNAEALVHSWPTSGSPTQSFTLTPSVGSLTVQLDKSDKSASFTVAVAGTGGFAGSAALSASASSGVLVSFHPASVKAGASTTATITVAGGTPAGTRAITITGTSGSLTKTTTVNLTVSNGATLSIRAAASGVTVARGKSTTLVVTTTTAGAFADTVTLGVTGLPTDVTATWSPASFRSTGTATTQATLTLKASTTATLKTVSLLLTATGGGLTAHVPTTMQVTPAPSIVAALSASAINMRSTATQQVTALVRAQGGVVPEAHLMGVSFQVMGVPAGIATHWGAATMNANGTWQAVLTLAGSESAAASTGQLTFATKVVDAATRTTYSTRVQTMLVVTRAVVRTHSAD